MTKKSNRKSALVDRFSFEKKKYSFYKRVAGGDEAGRGPWAGPVVSAIVILDPKKIDPRIHDSKQCTTELREELFEVIRNSALSYGIGQASPKEIDRINILEATRLAFFRAWQAMPVKPDFILFDAIRVEKIDCAQEPIVHGDSLSFSIGAASILAKVFRDRLMAEYDRRYPGYGFARNKGYGVPEHKKGLDQFGVTPIHRKSFKPVAAHLIFA